LCHFATSHFGRFRRRKSPAKPMPDSPLVRFQFFVRFDDRLVTMLNSPAADAGAKSAIWMQIVDLLAQDRGAITPPIKARALERLKQWRGDVPERRRLASAVSVAGMQVAPDLIAYFASDSPVVAAPILLRAELSDPDWRAVIADCAPTSRALLRERRDMPDSAKSALAAYGLSDFALPVSAARAAAGTDDEGVEADIPKVSALPIGELVRRIEAYRDHKGSGRARSSPSHHQISSFAFESDSNGRIDWVEGAPRGPLIGISLADMAESGGYGVDGQASGAFRKRAAIRAARLVIPPVQAVGGEWKISAQPFFDTYSGRFEGYRGIGKRVHAGEALTNHPFGNDMKPESVRQLVHELRTPLNAIRGFAEMIEGQFLGSVEPAYRKRADAIISESGRLLRVFEDLDVTARIASGAETAFGKSEANICRILRETATHHAQLADERAARLQISMADQTMMVLVDEASIVRLLDRLLLCVLSTAHPKEAIRVSLTCNSNSAQIEATRPSLLRAVSDETLLDPAFEPGDDKAGEDLPLGLAFVLRLIKQLARRAGGRFEINSDRFVLILPRQSDSAVETIEVI
jgi:hypothetical protein